MWSLVPARSAALLLFALTGASSAPAQVRAVPSVSLDKGAAEVTESFSQLSGLVELRDGRVLVLDAKEKELRLVDLSRGTMTRVSRVGGGPLEYQVPGFLLTGAADTVLYFDVMQRRFLRLSQNGIPLSTVLYGPRNPQGASAQMDAMLSQMIPMAVDAAGRIYGQTMGMSGGVIGGTSPPEMPKFADTVEIQSLDVRSGQVKTLARIRSPMAQSSPKMQMSGRAMKMTLTAPDYQPSTTWTVLPDGRLAILRDGVYRVHFIAAGHAETLGPTIPFTPVPVTAGERRALVDSLRTTLDTTLKQMRKSTSAMGGAPDMVPKIEAQVLEPKTWAATKPAYVTLMSSTDGRLWVLVSIPAGSKVTRLDVLNGTGALLAHVQMAAGERFVGLGRGTVYTSRTDQDDLQYLRRYRLPKLE